MENIYLDKDNDGNLVITQGRRGVDASRVVLTPEQVTIMVDMLLGPARVKNVTVDMGEIAKKIADSKTQN